MIRNPAVAGFFYPAEPEELERLVSSLFPAPATDPPEAATAVMAPHAGLIYSGRVAAATFGAVRVPRRAILLGPNHTGLGVPLSVWSRGSWIFPGGTVGVDEGICQAILDSCPAAAPDREAHRKEHCLEVQLPFLLRRSPDVRIAPVVVGTSRLETLEVLGGAVARAVEGSREPVLIVISSDMTHYEPAAVAARKDRAALREMETLDVAAFRETVLREEISMCGFAPAIAGLLACRRLRASSGRLVAYAHSGLVTGDDREVVGYAGMVFS
jgi:hypothetical protein